jgi:hypothetical protein
MKIKSRLFVIVLISLLSGAVLWATLTQAAPGAVLLGAGSPTVVAYQGQVQVSDKPYNGTGYFKFAVVNAAGTTSFWSNNGSSSGGNEPTASVQLSVTRGLFNILLGDTSLTGMSRALTANVFSYPNRYLRVWFSTDNVTFTQLSPDTRIASVPYALQAQEAVDADTVDGFHASQLQTHYHNVVVVAKSGGDYTIVQAAIDSITTAAANNPFLVWVAPGVYSETVTMKPHVHMQGAGQKVTVITSTTSSSTWPPTDSTLALASDVSLRDLTVGNGGSGDENVALLATAGVTRTRVADVIVKANGEGTNNHAIYLDNAGSGVSLQRVNALAENGSNYNIGLINTDGASALLRAGSYTARGGVMAWAILNSGTGTTLDGYEILVLAEDGSNNNFGFYNYNNATAELSGGSMVGRGGMQTRGIENAYNGSKLTAHDVDTIAENGSEDNYGLGNYDSASATVRNCSFTARGGTNSYGVASGYNGVALEAYYITALAESASDGNYGLHNFGDTSTAVFGGSFTGRGGTDAYGIYNSEMTTTLAVESATILAELGSNSSTGLLNQFNAEARVHSGAITARGGTDAYGIVNYADGVLMAENIFVLATEGGTNYGLYSENASSNVTSSSLEGADYSTYRSSGDVTVSHTRLDGSVNTGVTCVAVSDGSTFYAGSCPP